MLDKPNVVSFLTLNNHNLSGVIVEKIEEKVVNPEEVKETSDQQIEEKVQETSAEKEEISPEIETIAEEPLLESEEVVDENNFEHMLEESLANIKNLEVGDKISGEIIKITDSYIFVTLGGKRDCYANKEDYLDKKGKLSYEIGQKLTGYVVKCSDTETLIAKSLYSVNLNVLHSAYEEKIPVQGKVQSMTKGGYIIDISGIKAFCPISQIDGRVVIDPKKYMNSEFDFRIIEFKKNGKNIVVSRRKILDEEKEVQKKETLSQLNIGDIITGKVTRLTNFGAFVDIGGVDGLLHISQFSWSRVESPSEILNIGDEIKAKIIKLQGEKISLSMKALQENPVETAMKEFNEGDIVSCRVVRNLPFGSFVEIRAGVEGLIPISELARGRRINNPSEVVKEGDLLEAQILKIDPEKQKISLSLKALQPDPWDNIDEFINEDDIVTGTIENVASFGAFIKLSEGVTGLLPNVKMKIAGIKLDKNKIGEEFKVRVVKIDKDARRISLEPTNMPESAVEAKDDWHKYKKQKSKKTIIDEDSPFANL
jgi:small subunit ribosomal protein S1